MTGTFGITQGVKLCDTVDPPSSQTAQHHVARTAPPRPASSHVGSPVHVRCYAAQLSDLSGTIVARWSGDQHRIGLLPQVTGTSARSSAG